MTKQEAIIPREEASQIIANWLASSKYEKGKCGYIEGWFSRKDVEAFRMAIESLEQESIKFYYVESIDDYWIGRRIDNFYYATWHERFGFIWSHSKYLPWGEHVVDENTWWKEHTYPSEPKEIPFTEWIVGFAKKYFKQEPKSGKWIDYTDEGFVECPFCHSATNCEGSIDELKYCFSCGARLE